MNKNQLKILEAKLDEQKAYIQELESRLNVASSEIVDNKNILGKTHEQIKKLNEELSDVLDFMLMLEEEKFDAKSNGILGLQDYMRSTIISEDKDLLFGLNIDKKFIQNRSIPTIKYYLYSLDCFTQEEYQLKNLKISQKKDLSLIIKTLTEYIKLSFKNKNAVIKGIVEIIATQELFSQNPQDLSIKFYGNHSIKEEIQSFIALYSQKN